MYGNLYTPAHAGGPIRGTVLLFQWSMSNRGEYETLGERFAAAGYFALAMISAPAAIAGASPT